MVATDGGSISCCLQGSDGKRLWLFFERPISDPVDLGPCRRSDQHECRRIGVGIYSYETDFLLLEALGRLQVKAWSD